MSMVRYHTADVDGLKIFYREAGPHKCARRCCCSMDSRPAATCFAASFLSLPTVSTSSHRICPGFGQSDLPSRDAFSYTFARSAEVIGRFTEVVNLKRFAIYIFDYGAPVGLRIAIKHPERVTAIISQNGNAYEEGLSDGWNPIRTYWREPTKANRDALRSFLSPETTSLAIHPRRQRPIGRVARWLLA